MSDPGDRGPTTKPPPFDPLRFARDAESRLDAEPPPSRKPTAPPHPSHPALRDSCKDLRDLAGGGAGATSSVLTSTPTLGGAPVLMVDADDLESLAPGAQDRALLGFVDGKLTVEEILAVAHVDVVTGINAFRRLARLGIVSFRSP
jgi:hypothetical protein